MINIFTKKLPSRIATDVQERYDSLLPIFKAYAESKSDKYYAGIANNYEMGCFILGLAIFYKSVVVPLREAGTGFRDFRKKDVESIQIGKYIFSYNESRQIQAMYEDFIEVITRHQISEHLLLFSDIKGFARTLNTYFINTHD